MRRRRPTAQLTYPTGARAWRAWRLAETILWRRTWMPHLRWYAMVLGASALAAAVVALLGGSWWWGAAPVVLLGVGLPLATAVGPQATLRHGPLHLEVLGILRPERAADYAHRSWRRRLEAMDLPLVGLAPDLGGRRWVSGTSLSRVGTRRGRAGLTVGIPLACQFPDGALVEVETSDHPVEHALMTLWGRLGGWCEDEGRPAGEPEDVVLMIDGGAVRFTTRRCGRTWGAHARPDGVSISVVASGVEPNDVRLERVRDLDPYLRPERLPLR